MLYKELYHLITITGSFIYRSQKSYTLANLHISTFALFGSIHNTLINYASTVCACVLKNCYFCI